MKISVLIPCYNAASFLATTLSTVAKQNYPDLEVIVVDGGSTDNTLDIIKAHSHLVTRWVSESDRGQLDALGKAIGLATGDVCYWLNADDVVMPGSFRYVAQVFARHPKTEIVFSDDFAFSEEKQKLWVGATIRGMSFEDHFLFYRQMYSECVFWKRELTAQALPLDIDLRVYTDYSFFLPLRQGRVCKWVPRRLGAFRVVDQQMSQLHREKGDRERELIKLRMREVLKMSEREYLEAQSAHRMSFKVRQQWWPKLNSAARYAGRRLSADLRRKRLASFFFDQWLVPASV